MGTRNETYPTHEVESSRLECAIFPGEPPDCVVSCLVQEGDQVNTHIIAPGAIIALGLMYLKTNDM